MPETPAAGPENCPRSSRSELRRTPLECLTIEIQKVEILEIGYLHRLRADGMLEEESAVLVCSDEFVMR
jgi:hypothetical protein